MNNYDKKNNDTYIEKYSNHMVTDVEMHMFKDDKASIVSNGLRGNFSEESRVTAQNNVLHFEAGKTLNLQLLKYKNKQSIVPLSLMKRYEHKLYEITYTQKVPVFFNLETEKFVSVLDNRILRDLKDHPEFKEAILKISPSISVIDTKNNKQVLLSYDTLNDLYEDTTNIYKDIKQAYLKTMLKIYPSEDVIILKYSLKENKEVYFYPQGTYSPIINPEQISKHIFSSANIQFEFIKGRKIAPDYYYLYNKDNELSINEPFYLDKDKRRNANKPENKEKFEYVLSQDQKQLVIIPYSDYDWAVLSSLKEKIDSIFSDLDKLLLTQKTDKALDRPLTEINLSNYLALSDSSTKPRLKP